MKIDELKTLLFGKDKYDGRIEEHSWSDKHGLTVWIYTFNIDAILTFFKWMCDGTNVIELKWTGDYIVIEHFDDWLQDIDEEDLYDMFPQI